MRKSTWVGPVAAVLIVGGIAVMPTRGQDETQEIRIPENLPDPVGDEARVDAADLDTTLADPSVVLLDVREAWELERFGTREGYLHIPLAELEERLDELPRDKLILTA